MGKTYRQPGEVIDFTNDSGSAINVDSVIALPDRIAIALVTIAAGDTGSAAVEGVHELPKATPEAIDQGAEVFWNGTAITATATDNTPAGYAFHAGAEAETSILVKLRG